MPPLRQEIVVTYDSRGVARARDSLGRFVKQTEREVDGLERKFGRFGSVVKGALAGIATFIIGNLIGALRRVGTELFEIGSAVGETESKFRTVFGDAAENVSAFIDEFSQLSGLTRRQGQDFTSNIGAILQGMKATREESAGLSEQIVQLAGDLSSFSNVPIEEAFAAIRSGITGESEPLKRFGIILREDEVSLRALAETGKAAKASLTDLEKAQARINIITEKAGVAVGDLERTQDSAANAARRLTGFLQQQREEFAQKLIPAFEQLIEYGDTLLKQYSDQADALGGRLAKSLNDIVFDLITFAEQVRIAVGVIKDLGSAFDTSFLGDAGKLTLVEGIATELGRISNILIGTQRGFVQISLASAKLQRTLGFERDEYIAELEETNKQLLEEQVRVLTLVDERRKLKSALDEEADAAGAAGEAAEALSNALGNTPDTGGDDIAETARRAAEGLERLQAAAMQAIPPDFLSLAQNDLEEFNRQVTTLENELSSGAISAEEFAGALESLSADFIQRMSRLRDTLKEAGVLTPALEKAFNNAFKAASKGAEDTDKNLRKASDSLDSLVSAGRAVLRLASTFGDLSEGVERFASGVLDAIDNLAQLKRIQEQIAAGQQVSGIAQALPIIGIAAGAAGVFSGLIASNDRNREEMRRLQDSLRDNERAIRENTRELFSGQIGGDRTQQQIDAARGLVEAINIPEIIEQSTIRVGERGTEVVDPGAIIDIFGDIVDDFEDLGLGDIFTPFEELLKTRLGAGEDPLTVLNDILSQMAVTVAGLDAGLGTFADDVDGAISALRLFQEFVSDDVQDALRFFAETALQIPDLPPIIRDILTAALDPNLSDEERRKLFEEFGASFAKQLASGTLDLGGLTPEEAEALASEALRLGLGAGADVGGEDEFARSVQIARSITEIQANELIAIQESALFALQEIRDAIVGSGPPAFPTLPSDPSIPRDPFVSFGDINAGITEAEVPRLMVMIEDELRVRIRGGR